MRKVIVGAQVSMDGVMQAPGGPHEDPTGGFKLGGWVAPLASDPVFGQEIGKLFGEPFDLLLGRRTYEIFAAYWPFAEVGPYDDIAKTFNRITKYVATRKGVDLTWKGSVALRDAAKDVAKLKQEKGPALVTQGSTELVHALLAAGLVDEIRTFTLPVVLGQGWKFQAIQVNPEESQFLETQKYTAAECARIYGPGVAEILGYETGGSMTYANVHESWRRLGVRLLEETSKPAEPVVLFRCELGSRWVDDLAKVWGLRRGIDFMKLVEIAQTGAC